MLVMPTGLATLLPESPMGPSDRAARRTLKQLEEEVLPEFLHARRWFTANGAKVTAHPAREADVVGERRQPMAHRAGRCFGSRTATRQQYSLPLSLAWEDGPTARSALGRVDPGQR